MRIIPVTLALLFIHVAHAAAPEYAKSHGTHAFSSVYFDYGIKLRAVNANLHTRYTPPINLAARGPEIILNAEGVQKLVDALNDPLAAFKLGYPQEQRSFLSEDIREFFLSMNSWASPQNDVVILEVSLTLKSSPFPGIHGDDYFPHNDRTLPAFERYSVPTVPSRILFTRVFEKKISAALLPPDTRNYWQGLIEKVLKDVPPNGSGDLTCLNLLQKR